MLRELSEALHIIEKDTEIRCIIIIGEGKKAFSVGADITELHKLNQETSTEFSTNGKKTFTKIETLSKPVIAAINGYALGGGLELALVCDFRLASENSTFGFPEMKLGIIPGWGGTQRLTWTVGTSGAKRLIMLGENVNADQAYKIGLVDKVVPQKKLKVEVESLARKLCEHSLVPLKFAKNALSSAINNCLDSGLEKETALFAQLLSNEETKEKIEKFLSREKKEEHP